MEARRKLGAPNRIRFGDRDEAQFIGEFLGIGAEGVARAMPGAQHDHFKRGRHKLFF